jgi:hypothetical protein
MSTRQNSDAMTSTAQDNQVERFPLWATAIIAMAVVCYVGTYIAGILVIKAAQRAAKDLIDPKNIAMVATAIGGMPEKLPEGFTYRLAMSLNNEELKKWFGFPWSPERLEELAKAGPNIVKIDHGPDGQQIVIVSSPQPEPKDTKAILQDVSESGINTGTTFARFRSISQRGETEIAGSSMAYIIGETEDTAQKRMQGMIGCINQKNGYHTILVYGLQPEGDKYDLAQTLNLLHCMKAPL